MDKNIFFLFNFESFLTILEWNPLPISLSLLLNAVSSSVEIFFCTRETISSVTPLHWVHFIALSKQNPIIKKNKKKKKGRGPGCKKTANLIRGPHSKIVYSQDFVTRALLINSKYHIIIKDSTNFFSHFFVFSFILYFLFPCLFHIFFLPLFFLLFDKLRSSLFLPWIGIFCVQ